jgi:hypothetical protein
MKVKDTFPDEDALGNYFDTNINSLVQKTKDSIGEFELEYLKNTKLRRQGGVLIVLGILFSGAGYLVVQMSIYIQSQTMFWSLFLLFVSVGIYFFWQAYRKMKGTSKPIAAFHTALNDFVFPIAFQTLGLTARRINNSLRTTSPAKLTIGPSFLGMNWGRSLSLNGEPSGHAKALVLLDSSELITESRNTVVVDDVVMSSYDGRALHFSELDVKNVTGSGKNRRVKHIFHGYFVTFDLKRSLAGKTFVSTEGDKHGFGHQSFFSTKKNEGLGTTELEWNDFEDLLHVVTNDPTEARYVLTPDFMIDLHSWWSVQKQNIRISFIGDRMYILFPDKEIRIGKTIKRIDSIEIRAYLESICRPLMHVLHLVEDVRQ